MTTGKELVPVRSPPEVKRLPSTRERALMEYCNGLLRLPIWEVPPPVAIDYWLRVHRGNGDVVPGLNEGPFGRWFWELSLEERERFFAPGGYIPPTLGRTMVKLITFSLGLKFSLWELPDNLAELIEQAQTDLFAGGAITDSMTRVALPSPQPRILVHAKSKCLAPPDVRLTSAAKPTSILCTSTATPLALKPPKPQQQLLLFPDLWLQPFTPEEAAKATSIRRAPHKAHRTLSTDKPRQPTLFDDV
jgi:hypothetical protein